MAKKTKVLRTYLEPLPCPLTDEEYEERSQSMSLTHKKLLEHQTRMKVVSKELKDHEKAIKLELARLADIVEHKREPRQVRVQDVGDFASGTISVIRLDNNEFVRSRQMEPEDRQGHLTSVFDREEASAE